MPQYVERKEPCPFCGTPIKRLPDHLPKCGEVYRNE